MYTNVSCGCVYGPGHEAPPGVAMSLTDPDAATRDGWLFIENERRLFWIKPCLLHADYGDAMYTAALAGG